MRSTAIATPLTDPRRLAAVQRLALLDTPANEAFDRLVRLAVAALRVPIALVTLVTEDRQFVAGGHELSEPWTSARGMPLSHSFCQHVVTRGEAFVVTDARRHPVVHENAAITDLGVIAYLGAPLVTPDGFVAGSFCAIDTAPRTWAEGDVTLIRDLAALATREMEYRAGMRRQEQLAHRAAHDFLTDLPNRRTFMGRLMDALAHTSHRQDTLAVVFIDVDDFKAVNDRFGHAAGDRLLILLGQRVQSCLRAGDMVARLGGDEFVALLTGLENAERGIEIAERIMTRLQEPYDLDGQRVRVGVSVGIARNATARDGARDLLRDADVAMYRAKRFGKGRYEVF